MWYSILLPAPQNSDNIAFEKQVAIAKTNKIAQTIGVASGEQADLTKYTSTQPMWAKYLNYSVLLFGNCIYNFFQIYTIYRLVIPQSSVLEQTWML